MAGQRAILRNLQLRFCVSLYSRDRWRSSRPRGRARSPWRSRSTAGATARLSLDGLGFIILGLTPEAMGKGNWSVGVIADARASAEQRDAITAIASGSAGGPMAALSALVGTFLGVESAPIRFDRAGVKWSVTAAKLVDMAAEPAMGVNPDITEPLYLDNTGHPAANRVALAHALKSHVDALGLSWNDTSGKNNGQYAPFSWRGA